MADALESVLSENALRVYGAPWCLFIDRCADVGLHSLPAEPLTVARHLAARADAGATIAISKVHEWARLESPCRYPGVRAFLKG